MRELKGQLEAKGLKFGLVVSRYNETVSRALLTGAVDAIERHGGKNEDLDVAWVPGTFEVPLAAQKLAESGRYDAIICLGAVVRGATSHHEYVAGEAARGIGTVTLKTGVPVIFGIVTAETLEQAFERAGTLRGNRGADAALAGIEMANLGKEIKALACSAS